MAGGELLAAAFSSVNSRGDEWWPELCTVETMLADRRYTPLRMQMHGEEPLLLATCRDAKGGAVLVYLSHESKVGVRTLRKIRSECSDADSEHLILISLDGLTPFATRELADAEHGMDTRLQFYRQEKRRALPPPPSPVRAPSSPAVKQRLLSRFSRSTNCVCLWLATLWSLNTQHSRNKRRHSC